MSFRANVGQEKIEKTLSYYFCWYLWGIVGMHSLNLFFIIFHTLDTEDSKETRRYELGRIGYMTFFFLLFPCILSLALCGNFTQSSLQSQCPACLVTLTTAMPQLMIDTS